MAAPEQLSSMQDKRKDIKVSDPIREYITSIVTATRNHESLRFGSRPRGSLGLTRAAQGLAALNARSYILPDDVKRLVTPVLSHRII